MISDENLQGQLEKLGFENFSDFIRLADPVPDALNPSGKNDNQQLWVIQGDDGIDYFFTVQENPKEQNWHIHSIQTDYLMRTERNKSGLINIGKTYTANSRGLPDRQRLQRDIEQLKKAEEVSERMFLSRMNHPGNGQGKKQR